MQIIYGTIRAYNNATHEATVQPSGSPSYITVPAANNIQWWQIVTGHQCAILMNDDTDTTVAVLLAVWRSGVPAPLDPHFDPSIGHQHRGIEDDAPILP